MAETEYPTDNAVGSGRMRGIVPGDVGLLQEIGESKWGLGLTDRTAHEADQVAFITPADRVSVDADTIDRTPFTRQENK